jgi:GNAT superfamily N-acetyltransferase
MEAQQPKLWKQGRYVISNDDAHLDLDVIHRFLSEDSYWAKGRSRETVERSIRFSLCYGLFEGEPGTADAKQIGFARFVTDMTAFAWLSDVFVLPEYRGQGLAKWLVGTAVDQPEMQELKRIMLATADMQPLYRQLGFQPMEKPENFMQISRGTLSF